MDPTARYAGYLNSSRQPATCFDGHEIISCFVDVCSEFSQQSIFQDQDHLASCCFHHLSSTEDFPRLFRSISLDDVLRKKNRLFLLLSAINPHLFVLSIRFGSIWGFPCFSPPWPIHPSPTKAFSVQDEFQEAIKSMEEVGRGWAAGQVEEVQTCQVETRGDTVKTPIRWKFYRSNVSQKGIKRHLFARCRWTF